MLSRKKVLSSPSLANMSDIRRDDCFLLSGTKGRKRLHKAWKALFTQYLLRVYYGTGINSQKGPKKILYVVKTLPLPKEEISIHYTYSFEIKYLIGKYLYNTCMCMYAFIKIHTCVWTSKSNTENYFSMQLTHIFA